MTTRRLLTAVSLALALTLTVSPAQAGWDDPWDGPVGMSQTVDTLTQAAVLGLELSRVAL